MPKGEFIPMREMLEKMGSSAHFGVVFWREGRTRNPAVDRATAVENAQRAPSPPPVRPGFSVWRMHVDDPHAPPPDYSDHAVVIPEAFRDRHYRALLRLWAAGAKSYLHKLY